jgi:hypothetical protein
MSRQFAGWSGVRRKLGKKEVRRECVRGSRKFGVLYTNADFYCTFRRTPNRKVQRSCRGWGTSQGAPLPWHAVDPFSVEVRTTVPR